MKHEECNVVCIKRNLTMGEKEVKQKRIILIRSIQSTLKVIKDVKYEGAQDSQ